jgi:hypothetical protein
MGQTLDQILTQVGDGDQVGITLASNQDNGIVGYAVGDLVFHKATGGVVRGAQYFVRHGSSPVKDRNCISFSVTASWTSILQHLPAASDTRLASLLTQTKPRSSG